MKFGAAGKRPPRILAEKRRGRYAHSRRKKGGHHNEARFETVCSAACPCGQPVRPRLCVPAGPLCVPVPNRGHGPGPACPGSDAHRSGQKRAVPASPGVPGKSHRPAHAGGEAVGRAGKRESHRQTKDASTTNGKRPGPTLRSFAVSYPYPAKGGNQKCPPHA